MSRCSKIIIWLSVVSALSATLSHAGERVSFKVCADPHSLPSSANDLQGYENKIAKMFAEDLRLPLVFEWFPQRIGFIRNTLRNNDTPDGSFKCDIVMGVPEGFELAATTKPYFHSAWAMVYVKGRGWDDIQTQQDLVELPPQRKDKLRIGLFEQSPAAFWLARHGLMAYMTPYPIMSGDPNAYPGQIIEQDLVQDRINLTFVWGPIAGYFAKRTKDKEIVVIPMKSEPGIKFDYGIAMAVRHGEKAWKKQIDQLLAKHKNQIKKILLDYGVPLLEEERG